MTPLFGCRFSIPARHASCPYMALEPGRTAVESPRCAVTTTVIPHRPRRGGHPANIAQSALQKGRRKLACWAATRRLKGCRISYDNSRDSRYHWFMTLILSNTPQPEASVRLTESLSNIGFRGPVDRRHSAALSPVIHARPLHLAAGVCPTENHVSGRDRAPAPPVFWPHSTGRNTAVQRAVSNCHFLA